MRLPTITGEFRLVEDPDLRFTPSGKAVANLRLVASESRKNPQTNEWEDGDRVFLGASVWNSQNGQEAEDVAERFVKGERVLVTGQLYAREYETRDGGKGQAYELKFITIGQVPGGKPRGQQDTRQGQPRQQQRQGQDPWATPQAGGQDPWATPSTDQPPF